MICTCHMKYAINGCALFLNNAERSLRLSVYVYIYEMLLHTGITQFSFHQILKHNSNKDIRSGN